MNISKTEAQEAISRLDMEALTYEEQDSTRTCARRRRRACRRAATRSAEEANSESMEWALDVAEGHEQNMLLEALKGRVMEAWKSPHANYVLQKCIEVAPAAQLGFVIEGICGQAALTAKHRFGCRIVERLIEHQCAELSTSTLMEFQEEIVAEAPRLHSFAYFVLQHVLESKQCSGWRGAQEAIENASIAEQEEMVKQFHGHAQELLRSPHGNHVVQKVVVVMPKRLGRFIIDEFMAEGVVLARHRFGCRVLQRLLEHWAEDADMRAMMKNIEQEVAPLCCHAFGHHVIQAILEHGSEDQRALIAWTLHQELSRMACNRNACYVLEKALQFCTPEDQEKLIQKFVGHTPTLLTVMKSCPKLLYLSMTDRSLGDESAVAFSAAIPQDLLGNIFANFERRDCAAASVCPAWKTAWDRLAGWLLSPNLLVKVFANFEGRDYATAQVCRAWKAAWDATDAGRPAIDMLIAHREARLRARAKGKAKAKARA